MPPCPIALATRTLGERASVPVVLHLAANGRLSEAASVLTLRMIGVAIPVALSATLLFRGLTFWLPMLPGYWFSRRAITRRPAQISNPEHGTYWALQTVDLLRQLRSSPEGLSSAEAGKRLSEYGPNELRERHPLSRAGVLLKQIRSPLLLLLVFAAAASALSGEWLDSAIVLTIVIATVAIGYSREFTAQSAAAALRARVRVRTTVLRDGRQESVPVEHVVPGDVVLLSAGSLVPADGVVLEATDCFVSEAVLTGESFPVEKRPGISPGLSVSLSVSLCVSG